MASFVALMAVAACGAGTAPQVSVLGVSQARTVGQVDDDQLVVFVEVVNPTNRDLQLSRLEYNLDATTWFSTKGRVALTRSVPAGSSAVVEIPVPLKADRGDQAAPPVAAYELKGRLFAVAERIERSWKVRVKGDLSQSRAQGRVRLQVADAD